MHLCGFDHIRNRPALRKGLARLGPLIEAARRNADGPTLLVDNGDTLHGTPLGETAATLPCTADHPLVATMSLLGYDAMGLGNHDFDYGAAYLHQICRALTFPVICANVDGLPRDAVVTRTILRRPSGVEGAGDVAIGLTSVLPEQTGLWAKEKLPADIRFSDPVQAARREIAALREEGADVVVVLAHSGIDPREEERAAENFVTDLARLDGVDAIIAGHTHEQFPAPSAPQSPSIDPQTGLVHGVPCVMPGHGGEFVGQITLNLRAQESGWTVTGSSTQLFEAFGQPEDFRLLGTLQAVRQQTKSRLNEVIGEISDPAHSYFSMLRSSRIEALIAEGYRLSVLRSGLPAAYAELPVLASVSIAIAGGHGGPAHYVDLPAGDITLRAIEAISPYEDDIAAVVMTGAEIHDWLERSAAGFSPQGAAGLISPDMPCFNFDMISGLDVLIDPHRAPRYAADGQLIDPANGRIVRVLRHGKAVAPDDRFVVAMTSFRANGGGRFPNTGAPIVTERGYQRTRSALIDLLRSGASRFEPLSWSLVSRPGADSVFLTSPRARAYLGEIAHLNPRPMGLNANGFLQIAVAV